jgi:hypothetical protein
MKNVGFRGGTAKFYGKNACAIVGIWGYLIAMLLGIWPLVAYVQLVEGKGVILENIDKVCLHSARG